MIDKTKVSFLPKCVHAGNGIDKETGAIRRPIIMTNSYRLPEDASVQNWSSADQTYLQEKLASLEGGKIKGHRDQSL